jgi:hypothetical protein
MLLSCVCNYWIFVMHLEEDVYKVGAPEIVIVS